MNLTYWASLLPVPLRNRAGTLYFKLLHRAKYGDWHFPYSVSIEIATQCNRSCYYCPNSVDKLPLSEMEWSTFETIIQRLQDINWTGAVSYHFLNEPLLTENLEDYIRYTRKHLPKALPRVYSNADFLTEARLRSLLDAGMTQIVITQHPPVKPGWVENILALEKQYPTAISFRGKLQKEMLVNWGGSVTEHNIASNYKTCPSIETAILVTTKGDVLLCCQDYDKQHVMGNLKYSGLLEIWNRLAFKSLRKAAFSGKVKLELCRKCLGVWNYET